MAAQCLLSSVSRPRAISSYNEKANSFASRCVNDIVGGYFAGEVSVRGQRGCGLTLEMDSTASVV